MFEGKGSALDRVNYRGLKLIDQVLKVVERVSEKMIRECIVIYDIQFCFMPGHGTTGVIFIVRQFQEKFFDKNKNLYLAFIHLKTTFNRVPHKVLRWTMRVAGVPEWIVVIV